MGISDFDPALTEVQSSGSDDDWIGLIGRIVDAAKLPTDARVISQFGDVATFRVRRRDLAKLSESGACDILEASRNLRLPSDDPDEFTLNPLLSDDAGSSYRIRPDGVQETGNGVLLGVIDWGLDVAHPAFRSPDGSSRVLAIWDQRARGDRPDGNRWGYGRILSQEMIDNALREPNPYVALDYDPADADSRGRGSHATHVTAIAAGSDVKGNGGGVAPGTDIAFVHLARTTNILDKGNLGDSVSLLEALDFIFELAGERACVVNLSVGAHSGNHKGNTLIERGIDAAVWLEPNRAVVNSAGNYREKRAHAQSRVRTGESSNLRFVLPDDETDSSEIEVFYSDTDRFEVTITSPSGEKFGPIAVGENISMMSGEVKIGHAYHRHDARNFDNHFDLFLYDNSNPGEWQLELFAEKVVDGRYHAWIERDSSNPPKFVGEQVDKRSTIGTIANGAFSITCGAFDSHDENRSLARFSSAGPTRTGRLKPEVVAPGVRISSAQSTPGGREPGPRFTEKSGTSMAAPHCAGAMALMYEVVAAPLEISEARALLFSSLVSPPSCQQRTCSKEDIHRTGHGYLDIAKTVEAAANWKNTMHTNESRNSSIEQSMPDRTPDADTVSPDRREDEEARRVEVSEGLLTSLAQLAINEFDRQRARAVIDRKRDPRQNEIGVGDLLVRDSLGEDVKYHGVILGQPRRDLSDFEEVGLPIENRGPGLYAEVLEASDSRSSAQRVVRRIADCDGRISAGQFVACGEAIAQAVSKDGARTNELADVLPDLSAWQRLISFRPPTSVQRSLARSWNVDFRMHKIEDAHGPVNLDYYPVTIQRFPTVGGRTMTAAQLYRALRLNINRFIDTRYAEFAPYDSRHARRWRSSHPLGAALHIDMKAAGGYINPDDGSILAAEYTPNHWIFSTIWTPADFGHPVSGNREFGFTSDDTSGDVVFYTRGADRTTGAMDNLLSGVVFSSADKLWKSLQEGIRDFVVTRGGIAVMGNRTSRRFNWSAVKRRYWRPTVSWL